MMHIHMTKRQHGVTLIEALIALLVLSVGLVGLSALMLTSLKNVHSSSHYSVAAAIVLDFEEQIWSEVAKTAISETAALDGNGCLSDDDISGIATAITSEWNTSQKEDGGWTTADRFQLPGMELSIGDTSVEESVDSDGDSRGVFWKTIPTTLTWDEGRFSDGSGENYSAAITVVCRPVFLL